MKPLPVIGGRYKISREVTCRVLAVLYVAGVPVKVIIAKETDGAVYKLSVDYWNKLQTPRVTGV